MTHDVKVNLTRAAVVLGALVALVAVTTAAMNVFDDRYVRRQEHAADLGQIKADLRVLRCAVAKDCR